jgi:hypothetical protein
MVIDVWPRGLETILTGTPARRPFRRLERQAFSRNLGFDMPWKPRELMPRGEVEDLARALRQRSRVALPEGLMGILRSLGELNVEEMMAGEFQGDGYWLIALKPDGLRLFTWTGDRQVAVKSTTVRLAAIDHVTLAWDADWIFKVQVGASQTELHNHGQVVAIEVVFREPVGPDQDIEGLEFSVSGVMVLEDRAQAVDWALRLQARLLDEE